MKALREQSYRALEVCDYEQAISLRTKIINSGHANIGDYCSIGEYAIELCHYDLADKIFTRCNQLGKEEGNMQTL